MHFRNLLLASAIFGLCCPILRLYSMPVNSIADRSAGFTNEREMESRREEEIRAENRQQQKEALKKIIRRLSELRRAFPAHQKEIPSIISGAPASMAPSNATAVFLTEKDDPHGPGVLTAVGGRIGQIDFISRLDYHSVRNGYIPDGSRFDRNSPPQRKIAFIFAALFLLPFRRFQKRTARIQRAVFRRTTAGLMIPVFLFMILMPGFALFAQQPYARYQDQSRQRVDMFMDRAQRLADDQAWSNYVFLGIATERVEWETDAFEKMTEEQRQVDRSNQGQADREREKSRIQTEHDAAKSQWEADAQNHFLTGRGEFRADHQKPQIDEISASWYEELIAKATAAVSDEPELNLNLWNSAVVPEHDAKTAEIFASLDEKLNNARDQFPTLAPEEKAAFDSQLNRIADGIRREFEIRDSFYIARARNRYIALKRSDDFLGGLASDQQSADAITDAAIEDTRDAVGQTTQDSLDSAVKSAESALSGPSPDVAGTGAQWEKQIESMIQSGLRKWEAAEEGLYSRRLVWMEETKRSRAEAEKIWAQNQDRLKNARESWLQEVQKTIAQGRSQFDQKFAELQKSRDSAEANLAQFIAEEKSRRDSVSRQLSDMIAGGGSALLQAKDALRYYRDLLDRGAYTSVSQDGGVMKAFYERQRDTMSAAVANFEAILAGAQGVLGKTMYADQNHTGFLRDRRLFADTLPAEIAGIDASDFRDDLTDLMQAKNENFTLYRNDINTIVRDNELFVNRAKALEESGLLPFQQASDLSSILAMAGSLGGDYAEHRSEILVIVNRSRPDRTDEQKLEEIKIEIESWFARSKDENSRLKTKTLLYFSDSVAGYYLTANESDPYLMTQAEYDWELMRRQRNYLAQKFSSAQEVRRYAELAAKHSAGLEMTALLKDRADLAQLHSDLTETIYLVIKGDLPVNPLAIAETDVRDSETDRILAQRNISPAILQAKAASLGQAALLLSDLAATDAPDTASIDPILSRFDAALAAQGEGGSAGVLSGFMQKLTEYKQNILNISPEARAQLWMQIRSLARDLSTELSAVLSEFDESGFRTEIDRLRSAVGSQSLSSISGSLSAMRPVMDADALRLSQAKTLLDQKSESYRQAYLDFQTILQSPAAQELLKQEILESSGNLAGLLNSMQKIENVPGMTDRLANASSAALLEYIGGVSSAARAQSVYASASSALLSIQGINTARGALDTLRELQDSSNDFSGLSSLQTADLIQARKNEIVISNPGNPELSSHAPALQAMNDLAGARSSLAAIHAELLKTHTEEEKAELNFLRIDAENNIRSAVASLFAALQEETTSRQRSFDRLLAGNTIDAAAEKLELQNQAKTEQERLSEKAVDLTASASDNISQFLEDNPNKTYTQLLNQINDRIEAMSQSTDTERAVWRLTAFWLVRNKSAYESAQRSADLSAANYLLSPESARLQEFNYELQSLESRLQSSSQTAMESLKAALGVDPGADIRAALASAENRAGASLLEKALSLQKWISGHPDAPVEIRAAAESLESDIREILSAIAFIENRDKTSAEIRLTAADSRRIGISLLEKTQITSALENRLSAAMQDAQASGQSVASAALSILNDPANTNVYKLFEGVDMQGSLDGAVDAQSRQKLLELADFRTQLNSADSAFLAALQNEQTASVTLSTACANGADCSLQIAAWMEAQKDTVIAQSAQQSVLDSLADALNLHAVFFQERSLVFDRGRATAESLLGLAQKLGGRIEENHFTNWRTYAGAEKSYQDESYAAYLATRRNAGESQASDLSKDEFFSGLMMDSSVVNTASASELLSGDYQTLLLADDVLARRSVQAGKNTPDTSDDRSVEIQSFNRVRAGSPDLREIFYANLANNYLDAVSRLQGSILTLVDAADLADSRRDAAQSEFDRIRTALNDPANAGAAQKENAILALQQEASSNLADHGNEQIVALRNAASGAEGRSRDAQREFADAGRRKTLQTIRANDYIETIYRQASDELQTAQDDVNRISQEARANQDRYNTLTIINTNKLNDLAGAFRNFTARRLQSESRSDVYEQSRTPYLYLSTESANADGLKANAADAQAMYERAKAALDAANAQLSSAGEAVISQARLNDFLSVAEKCAAAKASGSDVSSLFPPLTGQEQSRLYDLRTRKSRLVLPDGSSTALTQQEEAELVSLVERELYENYSDVFSTRAEHMKETLRMIRIHKASEILTAEIQTRSAQAAEAKKQFDASLNSAFAYTPQVDAQNKIDGPREAAAKEAQIAVYRRLANIEATGGSMYNEFRTWFWGSSQWAKNYGGAYSNQWLGGNHSGAEYVTPSQVFEAAVGAAGAQLNAEDIQAIGRWMGAGGVLAEFTGFSGIYSALLGSLGMYDAASLQNQIAVGIYAPAILAAGASIIAGNCMIATGTATIMAGGASLIASGQAMVAGAAATIRMSLQKLAQAQANLASATWNAAGLQTAAFLSAGSKSVREVMRKEESYDRARSALDYFTKIPDMETMKDRLIAWGAQHTDDSGSGVLYRLDAEDLKYIYDSIAAANPAGSKGLNLADKKSAVEYRDSLGRKYDPLQVTTSQPGPLVNGSYRGPDGRYTKIRIMDSAGNFTERYARITDENPNSTSPPDSQAYDLSRILPMIVNHGADLRASALNAYRSAGASVSGRSGDSTFVLDMQSRTFGDLFTAASDRAQGGREFTGYRMAYRDFSENSQKILDLELSQRSGVQKLEWDLRMQSFLDRRSAWENRLSSIINRGRQAWGSNMDKYLQQWRQWERLDDRETEDAQKVWDARVARHFTDKKAWQDSMQSKAEQASVATTLSSVLSDLQSQLSQFAANTGNVPRNINAAAILNQTLAELQTRQPSSERLKDINNNIDNFNTRIAVSEMTGQTMGVDFQSSLSSFNSAMTEHEKDMRILANVKMAEAYRKIVEDFKLQLEDQNQAVDQQTMAAAGSSGFIRMGDRYVKSGAGFSALVGVDAYRFFDTERAITDELAKTGFAQKSGADLADFLENKSEVEVDSFFTMQRTAFQVAIGNIMGRGTQTERKNSRNAQTIGTFNTWVGSDGDSQSAQLASAAAGDSFSGNAAIRNDIISYGFAQGFGELGAVGARPSGVSLGFMVQLKLANQFNGQETARLGARAGGTLDPVTTTINQFNVGAMMANSTYNVRVASEVYGRDAGMLWEANMLNSVKQPMVAGGSLLIAGGMLSGQGYLVPLGMALSALGNSIQVNPTTGERSSKMTDQGAINTALSWVSGFTAGMLPPGTATAINMSIQTAAAGVRYDENGGTHGWSMQGSNGDAFLQKTVINAGAAALTQGLSPGGELFANTIISGVVGTGLGVLGEYTRHQMGIDNHYDALGSTGIEGLGNLAAIGISAYGAERLQDFRERGLPFSDGPTAPNDTRNILAGGAMLIKREETMLGTFLNGLIAPFTSLFEVGKMIGGGLSNLWGAVAGLFGGGEEGNIPYKDSAGDPRMAEKSLEKLTKDQLATKDERKNLASLNGQKADDFVALRLQSGEIVYLNKVRGDILNADGQLAGGNYANNSGGANQPLPFADTTQAILEYANSWVPGSEKVLGNFLRLIGNEAQNQARTAVFEDRTAIEIGAKAVSNLYGQEGSLEFSALREYLKNNGENVYQSYLGEGKDPATARAMATVFMAKMLNENARIEYGTQPGNTNNYFSTIRNPNESTYFYNQPINSGNSGVPKLDCAAFVALSLYLAGVSTGAEGVRSPTRPAGLNQVERGGPGGVGNVVKHPELFETVTGSVRLGDIGYYWNNSTGHILIVSQVNDAGQATKYLHSSGADYNGLGRPRWGVQESPYNTTPLTYIRLK